MNAAQHRLLRNSFLSAVSCGLKEWLEGWPAIRVDSSGQRHRRSETGALCQKRRDNN